MNVDYSAVRFYLDLMILLLVSCHSGFTIWDRRNKVTQEAVTKLREDVHTEVEKLRADLDLRRRRIDESMDALREKLSDAPTRMDLTRLYEAIGDVSQLANELRGTVQSLQNTMHLINQHLLEKNHG